MYICPKCKKENNNNSEYCSYCNSELSLNKKYRLIKKIGEFTYLAENNTEPRPDSLKMTVKITPITRKKNYIIKEFSLNDADNWEEEKNLKRENEILSQISHKSIPKIIENFKKDFSGKSYFYTVREFIEGKNLKEEFESKRYKENEVLDIIVEISQILDYLHSLMPPLVYLQLNLEHIIRKPDNHLALINFSNIRQLNNEYREDILEKYPYAAPEIIEGKLSLSSDFYSLGIMALVLLSRKPVEEIMPNWKNHIFASEKTIKLLSKLLETNPDIRISSSKETEEILGNQINAKNNTTENKLTKIFKTEFNKIEKVFSNIPKENNYKEWSDLWNTIGGFTFLGIFFSVFYYKNFWEAVLYSFIYFVAFVIISNYWYKPKAKKFLKLLLKDIYTEDNKELTLCILKSWSEAAHELGTEFKEVLDNFINKEIKQGNINFEKYENYKNLLVSDKEYENYIKNYMKEVYKKEEN